MGEGMVVMALLEAKGMVASKCHDGKITFL
jgi:hypothetical protein